MNADKLKQHEDYEQLAKSLHGHIRKTDQEYIICAAIHFADGGHHEHQPKNITHGVVVCGRRHHNCFMTLNIIENKKFKEIEQGFLTSKDRFVTRSEAGIIAFNCGQTSEIRKMLFSEDLY